MAKQFDCDLCDWDLVNHDILSTDDDFDGIYAEVQSLNSFPSSSSSDDYDYDDDGTLGDVRPELDLHDSMQSPPDCVDRNVYHGNISRPLIVQRIPGVDDKGSQGSFGNLDHDDCEDGQHVVPAYGSFGDLDLDGRHDAVVGDGCFGDLDLDKADKWHDVVVNGVCAVGTFAWSVDLGDNPFLVRETLHQFIDKAIDVVQNVEVYQSSRFHGSCGYRPDGNVNVDVLHEPRGSDNRGLSTKQPQLVEEYEADDHDLPRDDEEEDEMDCGYGLDDELVPWGVVDRLGRQRMRKLGNKPYARMTKSKRMAHIYTTRGCIHGKHGLGLKAC